MPPRREHRQRRRHALVVNLGKKDGISKGELSSLFQKMSGVAGADLYDVFVQDSYSFVEMPEAFAVKAMKRMSGMDYQGRLVVVEHAVARGDEAKGFSKKRSDAPRFPAKKREGRSYEGDAKPARKTYPTIFPAKRNLITVIEATLTGVFFNQTINMFE